MDVEKKILKIKPPVWGLVLVTILVFFLALYLITLIRNELKEYNYIGRSEQQIYTITIDGEGKVTAIPDIAQVILGVKSEKSNVLDAQQLNSEKMNKLIQGLKDQGVGDKDIKTTNYNIYPNYDWTSGQQVLKGYIVDQNVTVKIRTLDKISPILEMAVRAGGNQIGGLDFTIDEPEQLKQHAREQALVQAKEKAEALAKVAGIKLGKLVSFRESIRGGIQPYRYNTNKALDFGGDGVAPEVEPGSQEIIVNVTVTYEVL